MKKQQERNSKQSLFAKHVLFLTPFVESVPTIDKISVVQTESTEERLQRHLPEGGMTSERTTVLGRVSRAQSASSTLASR